MKLDRGSMNFQLECQQNRGAVSVNRPKHKLLYNVQHQYLKKCDNKLMVRVEIVALNLQINSEVYREREIL